MEIKHMVESIVRELVQAMQPEPVKPPKVLYVFCDSTAHEAFSDHFILLESEGIQHDLMFLDGDACAWMGMHKIESRGSCSVIAADEYAPAPIELPNQYDGIVIPEIDLDNAGRAALGMKGTVKSELIFSALVLGKFVLVGEDVPGLKRSDRRTLGKLELPVPYKKLFDYYRLEMAQFGVEFAPRELLAQRVVDKFASAAASSDPGIEDAASLPQEQGKTGETVFNGKLLSAEWVAQTFRNQKAESLTINRDAIISPLAKDLLKEKRIDVRYLDER